MDDPLLGFALVAALIFANGVFVATEFAYVAARRSRVQERAAKGSRAARVVLRAMDGLDRYIAASQLGITMASLALGFVGEPILAAAIEPPLVELIGSFAPAAAHAVAIGIAFSLITALHIIFGELAPKTIALQRPEGTALWVAWPMRVFVTVFGLAVNLLNGTGNMILRVVGIEVTPLGGERSLGVRDLAYAFESSASVGTISRGELQLARRALSLGEVPVRRLMIPRGQVVAVDESLDRRDVLRLIARHGRTRYPVVRGALENAMGILDAKDVVLAPEGADWHEFVRPVTMLPDTTTVGRAIEQLAEAGQQTALVIDEYGNIDGLLSLGDVLEFMAGPLPDERRRQRRAPRLLSPDLWEVPGHYALAAAAEEPLHLGIGATNAETLGGLIAERLQRLPQVGDTVELPGARLRVRALGGRRVTVVEVQHLERGNDEEHR
ncbi:MAG TPA: hemolysin family protein [Methylomirabilota bacterium]|nr:hemolysin family protein [Methylomirabilota bacterium]